MRCMLRGARWCPKLSSSAMGNTNSLLYRFKPSLPELMPAVTLPADPEGARDLSRSAPAEGAVCGPAAAWPPAPPCTHRSQVNG